MSDRKPASHLRVERVRAGWSLTALAAEVGINRSSLRRIEVGEIAEPRQEIRRALARALRAKEDHLFGKVGK
jgi:ribosome-binding protein aMBF1 (putative translation factor)